MTDKQIIDLTEIDQKYKDKCSLIKAGKCKNVNIFIEQSRKFKAKEQECENYKQLATKHCAETINMQRELDQLKAENEELKKQLKFEFDETLLQYSNELDRLKAENEELKNFHINLVGVKECEIKELVKLKQTLTEIKKIAQYDVYTSHTDLCLKLNWVKNKISKCEVENG